LREIRLNAVVPLNVGRETMEKILSIGLFLRKYRVRIQIAVLPTIRNPYIFVGDRSIDLSEVDVAGLMRHLTMEYPEIIEEYSVSAGNGTDLGLAIA